jgi:uncharacterized protein (TIGR00288 family)
MTNDVAIFLDLDNLVIGAKQANLQFDINFILDKIREVTGNGRIVLRQSYGDWRQNQKLLEQLTIAGFTTQSTVRINNFSKNLADMQIVVDTMDTLVDRHQFDTYVLVTGDRDFTPLVQSLRKRGKRVIGIGVKHTTSRSLVELCDEYIFYEDLVPIPELDAAQVEKLLIQAMDRLVSTDRPRIQASVLKQQMVTLSHGAFDQAQYGGGSFRKFLSNYPKIIEVEKEGTTIYVQYPPKVQPATSLHLRYRSGLKKKKFRIIAGSSRYLILKDIIHLLAEQGEMRWRQIIDTLAEKYAAEQSAVSKNMINDVLLAARQGQIIKTMKGRSLATAPVLLQLQGENNFQEAIVRCDAAYLREILDLDEPFDIEEASLALYDSKNYVAYLKMVMTKWMDE